jgi:RHS repeat-associated protein
VTFADGSTIAYTYAADGTKLRTVHNINGTTTTKDYCRSVIYENGAAKLWQTEAGYISMNDTKYHYYLQDHQGNNRVVVNETGATEEVNHYYAFGGLFSSDESVQPFKYNSKELDTKKGLNWYDYGARQYDAALGRWFAVDPLAEKYYNVSPYTFTGNYGFNVREVNGGLFIFVNGLNPYEYIVHAVSQDMQRDKPLFRFKPYSPNRSFQKENFYGWGGIDNLYQKKYNDENSLYINGSFNLLSLASERYNRGIKSGMELIQKLRSGEYELEEGETIKIIGYSMGGAYAAGMAYALMQDPEYAHLLQFVDYLAPYQPTDFKHPEGVLGRQFASLKDYFNTANHIPNINLVEIGTWGDFLEFGGHLFNDNFKSFLQKCFDNGVPIHIQK